MAKIIRVAGYKAFTGTMRIMWQENLQRKSTAIGCMYLQSTSGSGRTDLSRQIFARLFLYHNRHCLRRSTGRPVLCRR